MPAPYWLGGAGVPGTSVVVSRAGRTLAVAPGGPAAWGVQTCAQRGGSQPTRNRGLLRSSGAPSPLCLHKWRGPSGGFRRLRCRRSYSTGPCGTRWTLHLSGPRWLPWGSPPATPPAAALPSPQHIPEPPAPWPQAPCGRRPLPPPESTRRPAASLQLSFHSWGLPTSHPHSPPSLLSALTWSLPACLPIRPAAGVQWPCGSEPRKGENQRSCSDHAGSWLVVDQAPPRAPAPRPFLSPPWWGSSPDAPSAQMSPAL